MPSASVFDVDVASIAALIGDPARCTMLNALLGGSALPAGELARLADISPATATGHLHKLVNAGLLQVVAQGRHRYHRLSGARVASALEALALLAPPVPVRSLRQSRTASALAGARTCYDHLAGRLGVAVAEALLAMKALEPIDERDHRLTATGRELVGRLGIATEPLEQSRRAFARSCLDWTERRPHLAGALPSQLLTMMVQEGWLCHEPAGRALQVTKKGAAALFTSFGLTLADSVGP
ncbi:MAG: ArsR/SmtB family transcription factor [Candidatus Dormibacteria bacterium]